MNYTILDDNNFFAEGLRSSFLYHRVPAYIHVDEVRWHQKLLVQQILFIRCRFSITELHESLKFILLNLETLKWRGCIYLLCDEKGWALSTHMRKRFSKLTILIVDDRITVNDVESLLSKEPWSPRSINSFISIMEYNIIYLLIKGMSIRHIAMLTNTSEKVVFNYKYNALKKLNSRSLRQLLR